MIKLAVMGDPIAHSLSPQIHQQFAKQNGDTIEYQKIQVNKTQLPQALQDFWQQGGVGLSLTSPLKEAAMQYCDDVSDAARFVGAVNTLHRANGKITGHNTDVDGFLAAIKQDDIDVSNKTILVLGAGGAAKAVVYALAQQGLEAAVYSRRQVHVPEAKPYDIVINAFARAATLADFSAAPITRCELAFDLNYDDSEKIFAQFAEQREAKRYITGKNMLWQQAAKAYGIWVGAVISLYDE